MTTIKEVSRTWVEEKGLRWIEHSTTERCAVLENTELCFDSLFDADLEGSTYICCL